MPLVFILLNFKALDCEMQRSVPDDALAAEMLTEALGRVSIKESHLRTILLLQKAVERC